MLPDIENIVECYMPDMVDYSHPKIWYIIYNSSDDNKHPGDLEHVRSFKTLRQVYAYALGDREALIGCIDGLGTLVDTIDSSEVNTIRYTYNSAGYNSDKNGDYDEYFEFTIRKLRPKDIKLGWLIKFESFTRDFGYIRKIHKDYTESDYKVYNDGDKFVGCDECQGCDEERYKSEIDPQYYSEAANYVRRD